jgi:AcrR family transcriptional regulator
LSIVSHKASTGGPSPGFDRTTGAERIRRAGIALFKEFGYHGTSMRALADAVGLEAASLYYHFPSKQEILVDITGRTMDELLRGLQRALAGNGSHMQRLRNAVRFHVLYHVDRQDEAFVSHSELRSLTRANRALINAKRDRYEHTLRSFLHAGVEAGEFEIRDVPITTIAILMMCSGVSDWFADRGRLSGEQIAAEYADLVAHLVGRGGAGADRPGAGRRADPAAGPPQSTPSAPAARRRRIARADRGATTAGRPVAVVTGGEP